MDQFAFVKDRNIIDCILVANGSVEDYHRRKGDIIYQTWSRESLWLHWLSVDYVMAHKGFGNKWRSFHECLESSHSPSLLTACPKVTYLPLMVLDKRTMYPLSFSSLWRTFSVSFDKRRGQNLFKVFWVGKQQSLFRIYNMRMTLCFFWMAASPTWEILSLLFIVLNFSPVWESCLVGSSSASQIFQRPPMLYNAPYVLSRLITTGFL